MSLLKKIGEWTLQTFPLWGLAVAVSIEVYTDTSIPVVEYQDSWRRRYTPLRDFVGPLPASQMDRIVYCVNLDQSSTSVTQLDIITRTILYDSNQDGIVDRKTHSVGVPRRGIFTVDKPVTTTDQLLFTRVVAGAKKQ